MPRKPNPTPAQELPPFDSLVAVRTRLESFEKDPLAKHAREECLRAEELWKKDLHELFQDLIAESVRPKTDLKGLERSLKKGASLLEGLIADDGHTAELARVLAQYSDIAQITQALIDLARSLDVTTALPFAKKTEQKLALYVRAKKRVSEGGHPFFSNAVAHAATRIWIAHDNAYDILGVMLRKAAVFYDPVWAAMPTTRTTLRPELLHVPAGTAKPGRTRKKRKAKGSKQASAGAKQNGAKKSQGTPAATAAAPSKAPAPAA